MINSKQRSKLRALAHHLKPVVIIGKSGIIKGALSSIDKALDDHELIKVKSSDDKTIKTQYGTRHINLWLKKYSRLNLYWDTTYEINC